VRFTQLPAGAFSFGDAMDDFDIPTIDFETDAIDGNPVYNPPRPVGVSIKYPLRPSKYYAWGHPTGNNCTLAEGSQALLACLKAHGGQYIAHNAPFEASILKKYFGWWTDDPEKVHDTQYLLFLTDPYATSFSLKPSAERILGLPPDEQDAVKAWVMAHVPGAKLSSWGAHIGKAPGDLVGTYAIGDTDRTEALFLALYPRMLNAGMLESYRREQLLMPVLFKSSERGVRIDTAGLERDIGVYTGAKQLAEDYILRTLGEFNIDSDAELAAALDRAGQVTEWVLTPTGKRSTARKNLVGRVKDPALLAYMAYRGVLSTCLGTFAGPWLEQGLREGGRVHPQWNQVRGDKGADGDMSGTRTGRMSCRGPNLQNPPNDFEGLVIPEDIAAHISAFDPEMSHVPHMRKYLLPEEGHVWLKRDFSAQEMRIMAHFAEGKLFEAFKADPTTDPHVAVQKMIKELLDVDMPRKFVKITGFGIMYGRGVKNLSIALGVDEVEGKRVRDAYYAALPEIQELSYDTRNRGKRGQYIRTWGGRVYYREPDPGRDLSYKLLNYLIQGSAADQTKQAMVDHDQQRASSDILLAAVHDEINISAPAEDAPGAMRRLRTAMDADRFDVPFRSEGFKGQNWADIERYE
jgi:DNA polymerase I-like protein with 3'-5' exonuclease and polymerase domains